MIALLLLLACHRSDPETTARTSQNHPPTSPIEDTETETEDTGSTTPDPDPVLVWEPQIWEGSCDAFDLLDVNLPIPKGVPVVTYLRVADGYGVSTWRDAREGTVLWGADGTADIFCAYSGQDASWFPIVEGVRVVWVVQVER